MALISTNKAPTFSQFARIPTVYDRINQEEKYSGASKIEKAPNTCNGKYESDYQIEKNTSPYLKIDSIRGILHRFLALDRIDKIGGTKKRHPRCTLEELAKVLNISIQNLQSLLDNKASSELVHEISFPLAKLYCATKFIDQE